MKIINWFRVYNDDGNNRFYYVGMLRALLWVFIVVPLLFPFAFTILILFIFGMAIKDAMTKFKERITDEFDDFGGFIEVIFCPLFLMKSFAFNKKIKVPRNEFDDGRNRHGQFRRSKLQEFDEKHGKK